MGIQPDDVELGILRAREEAKEWYREMTPWRFGTSARDMPLYHDFLSQTLIYANRETDPVEGRDCVKDMGRGQPSLSYPMTRGMCHDQCLSWPTLRHAATRTQVWTGLQCIYQQRDLAYRHTFTSIVVPSTLLILHELEVSYTLQMCLLRLASIASSI